MRRSGPPFPPWPVAPWQVEQFSEKTTVEFGTPREVIFGSHLPLEFADTLRVETEDGSLNSDVSVVAIHYFDGSTTAVAARFTSDIANWIALLTGHVGRASSLITDGTQDQGAQNDRP